MKHRTLSALAMMTIIASWAQAQGSVPPTFYLSPGTDPAGDLAWQAALGGSFSELDFESFAPGADVDFLTVGGLTIEVGLDGIGGVAPTAEIFPVTVVTVPGAFSGNALLNRDAADQVHSQIAFDFPQPVRGAGVWVFDDAMAELNSSRMIVHDANGDVWTSGVLESGDGLAWAIEGFIGVTSPVGVTRVVLENLDATLQPTATFFELDHFQVGDVTCASSIQSTEIPRLGSPPNPNALLPGVTSGPIIGFTWDPVIDHSTFMPTALFDFLAITATATNISLPPLGTLLCDPTLTFTIEGSAAGGPFAVPVPNDCAFVGASVCTQGASLDALGNILFTNALDITIGTF